ncbi:MAG: alkaline phosphatase family protein [Chloroflexi bacterium]|nr:alkaline phosphatase family protein [Chloroflexota bacterium]
MKQSAQELEQLLRQRSSAAVWPEELAQEFLAPRYDGYSLVNVPATAAAILGKSLPGGQPLAPLYWRDYTSGITKVVVLLLDALGYLNLQEMLRENAPCIWRDLARRGILLPMTSTCPSTTTTALASLGTGVEPISHGLVGYELWLREYGVVADMITPKPSYGAGRETLVDWGLNPETFLPVPGVGERFGHLGIRTTCLISAQYLASSLSRMIYRGYQRKIGYSSAEDMWQNLYNLVALDDDAPSYYFAYWSTIDTAIHRYGSQGGYWQAELQSVSRAMQEHFLERLTLHQKQGVLFVMMADHGWVETPIDQAHDVEADAVLRSELLGPATGEARTAYLHCLAQDPGVVRRIQAALGDDYVLVPTAEAVQAGLWGSAEPMSEALARLGHVLVLSRGHHYLDRQGKRFRQRGRHGGMSPDEMLVPWLALRLDD